MAKTTDFQIPSGFEKIGHPSQVSGFTNVSSDPTNTFLFGRPNIPAPIQPPTGIPAGATQIFDPAELSGLTESQIFREPDSERIFRRQQATLTSPTGEKVVVDVGSEEANRLLAADFTLGDKIGGGTVDAVTGDSLTPEEGIDLDGAIGDKFQSKDPGETVEENSAFNKAVQSYLSLFEAGETEATKQEDTLRSQISDLLGETEGKEAFFQEQLDQELIEENKKELTNITNEINIKTAALNKRLQELKATPMTMARMTGASRQAIANTQSDIMFLQAQAQAAMNNISFAKELAQDATDAKYNPILDRIDLKLQQLEIITPIADKDEKNYIDALNLVLADQATATAEAKAQQEQLTTFNLNLMANNPTAGIRLTDSPEQATAKVAALPPEATEPKWGIVGQDEDGNNIYGFIDAGARTVTPFTPGGGLPSQVPISTVQSSGAFQTFEANGRALNLDSVAGASIDSIKSQAEALGGLRIGAVATSTFRTREQQQELYDRFLDGGPQAAPPGQSMHERGMAMDLFPDQEYIAQMKPIMESNGWFQTAGAHDLGHFDFLGTQPVAEQTQVVNQEVQNTADLVSRGLLTAKDALAQTKTSLQDDLKSALAGITTVEEREKAKAAESSEIVALQKVNTIDEILTHKGFDSAVGPTAKTRGEFKLLPFGLGKTRQFGIDAFGNKSFVIGAVQQVLSGLSLEELIAAKSRGATFGALSDTEMQILQAAATKIGTWAIPDPDIEGKVIGYKVKESDMRKELNLIKQTLDRAISPNRRMMEDGTIWEEQPDGNLKLIE